MVSAVGFPALLRGSGAAALPLLDPLSDGYRDTGHDLVSDPLQREDGDHFKDFAVRHSSASSLSP